MLPHIRNSRRPRSKVSLPVFTQLVTPQQPLPVFTQLVTPQQPPSVETSTPVDEPLPQVNPVRNVHTYDGKLEYKPDVPTYSDIDKCSLFDSIKSSFSPEAKKMIDIIKRGGNGDGANGYDASDLFYYLLMNAKGEDFYRNLHEQLVDMYRLGQCPQGRVIRLMSLVVAFVPVSEEKKV